MKPNSLLCCLLVSSMIGVSSPLSVSAAPDAAGSSENTTIDMFLSYTQVPTLHGVAVNAQVMLITHGIPLNAFEVELAFDPQVQRIEDIVLHPALCEPRFVIEKAVDLEQGVIRVSCGTVTPFVTGGNAAPVVTVMFHTEKESVNRLSLGDKTSFHIHNGLGTPAVINLLAPETIA